MRILDRYILKEFARNFAVALLALMMMFFVAEYLRGVWDEEVAAFTLLKYNLFFLPMLFCQMVSPASMIGVMVTLSLMNRKSELTAIFASGMGLGHVSFLLFGAIFIVSCVTLMVNDRIIPPSAYNQKLFYWRVIKNRQDYSLGIKTSKIWYRNKNFIYNLKLYDNATSTIRGISVYFLDQNFNLAQFVEAETAHYDQKENVWELKNGLITIFPEKSSFPISKHFAEKTLNLPETPKDFLEIERQVDTLRLKELLSFIHRNKEAGLEARKYEVDFHARIAVSFVPLIMGLLAIPYCVRPRRQGGLGKDLSICVGWIFAYWLFYSICLSMGRSGALTPWVSVWVPPSIFLFVAAGLIFRGREV